MKRVIFLDRDGTIIEDTHYINDPNDVHLIPGAIEALQALKRAEFEIYVVSNQSGVGRGIITSPQFLAVATKFEEVMKENGIQLNGIFYCQHHPDDGCSCRKPKTGLVPKNLSWEKAWMSGDTIQDVKFGLNLKAETYLVRTGKGRVTEIEHRAFLKESGCSVGDDLRSVAEKILKSI